MQSPASATSETAAVMKAAAPDGQEDSGRAAAPELPESFWTKVLGRTEPLVYVLVGLFFFLAALLSLGYGLSTFGYSVWTLGQTGINAIQPGSMAPTAIIDFVSDLLLTLIMMEVLGTVVQYLRTRETSLTPFLVIGIISATRGILAVGARLSITESSTLKPDDFRNDMIELAVNAAVIIALGVTIRLIGPYLREGALSRQRTSQPTASQK
jgi:uncharacterized membrane protein (DUF373 family)